MTFVSKYENDFFCHCAKKKDTKEGKHEHPANANITRKQERHSSVGVTQFKRQSGIFISFLAFQCKIVVKLDKNALESSLTGH